MEDAGQTIILRSSVIEVVDKPSCKSHEEADISSSGLLSPNSWTDPSHSY